MARARNIKPGFYANEDLAECDIWARFIFPGLWMLADRAGRLEDRPKRIKGELLRFDGPDCDFLLQQLAERGFILRYEVDGRRLIQILKFHQHQNPHHREAPSVLPAPAGFTLEVQGQSEASEASHGAQPDPHAELLEFETHGKPEASLGQAQGKPEASPGLTPPRGDFARGQNPADSLIPDSLIPDSLIRGDPPAPQRGKITTADDSSRLNDIESPASKREQSSSVVGRRVRGSPGGITSIDGVPEEVLTDWLTVRKAKKAGALTQTALNGLLREASRAGVTPSEAITVCVEANWVGFNADWYVNRMRGQVPIGRNMTRDSPTSHRGLAEKDYREGVNPDGTLA